MKVYISSFHASEQDVSKPSTRPHVVFVVEIYLSGRHHMVERRYKAFHHLHKQLKKRYHITLAFPPKRIRNWNARILEQRRQGLEHYLQALIKMEPIPELILTFLGLEEWEVNGGAEPEQEDQFSIMNVPIVAFRYDPFLDSSGSEFGNIITDGVTRGLYSFGRDMLE